MDDVVTVRLPVDAALDLLMSRYDYWRHEGDEDPAWRRAYRDMYEHYFEEGVFGGGGDFDPALVVDDDIVNWTRVCTREELAREFPNEDAYSVEVEFTDSAGADCVLVRFC